MSRSLNAELAKCGTTWWRSRSGEPRGQTDLEFLVGSLGREPRGRREPRGQTDLREPRGSIKSLWGQTDFEFSPLRPRAQFRCQEISPRVRFALERSGETRRQVRDALGAGEAKDRHEPGAGGLGMVLRQVGEGGAGRRAGAGRGVTVDPYRLRTPPRSPGRDPILGTGVAPGEGRDGSDRRGAGETIQESLHRGAIHAVPRPTGGQAG